MRRTPALGRFPRTASALLAALIASSAAARPVEPGAVPIGSDTVLTLDNFDTVRGRVLSVTDEMVVVQNEILGQVSVPLARISAATIAPTQQDAAKEAAEIAAAREVVRREAEEAEKNKIPEEAKLSFWQGWKGTAEVGLSGSEGNSQNFAARAGLGFKRVTDEMESTLASSYTYVTSEGDKTKSRGEIAFRNDWSFKESPWGMFIQAKAEYDEFQDWDWRLSGFAGPSYTVIKNDKTMLRLRAGAGITREFGGERNEIIPEALFGADFSQKLTERQSIFANFEYLPSLKSFNEYRTNTKAGYEILIDPDTRMSLKAGAEHRYDSEPGDDKKKDDFEYFLMLVWSF